MVEPDNSETAVIGKFGDGAVEVDSKQLMEITYIDGVIKEGGANDVKPAGGHPPQCAVRIDDGRFESAASPVKQHVVVAQIGVICPCFQDRRIVISAWIIESGGGDRGDSLL